MCKKTLTKFGKTNSPIQVSFVFYIKNKYQVDILSDINKEVHSYLLLFYVFD